MATDRQAQDAGATVRSFVALVERRIAEFVEFGVKHTLESGARYRNLPVEQLRASVSRGIRAVLEDLRAGTTDRYAGFWREIAVVRARAGFPIEALQRALELNEKLLVTAAHRQPEPLDRLAAIRPCTRSTTPRARPCSPATPASRARSRPSSGPRSIGSARRSSRCSTASSSCRSSEPPR